jgi:hypothetical protein
MQRANTRPRFVCSARVSGACQVGTAFSPYGRVQLDRGIEYVSELTKRKTEGSGTSSEPPSIADRSPEPRPGHPPFRAAGA